MTGVLHQIPLSVRVPLLAAVLMVLVGVVASQRVLATLEQVQEARVREVAEMHIAALSVALGPHVLRKDVWEVYDTLSRAMGEAGTGRMVFTAAADENGRILAATDTARAPVDSPIGDLDSGAQTPGGLSVSGDTSRVLLAAPLVYQGRDVGGILAELDVSDLIAERVRAARLLLAANTLAVGLLAVLGYLAMRRMLRPLSRLSGRMRETARSPEPLPEDELPRGDTELSRLFRTFNAMTEAVREKAETERRLAEREKYVSLGRLSSSLAHEINNPLGGLLNATDTIREYADRPEVVRQSAAMLERGLTHLRDVARATLDQNRVDRSAEPLTPEDFDDLRLLVEPEVSRNHQKLKWQADVQHGEISGLTAAPVRQIALNLLLNASAAAGSGGEVALDLESGDGDLRLRVSDSGPGMSKAASARLLGDDPVPPGGGVGLRLVHDMVRDAGGTVAVARRDGRTVVEVRLPVPRRGAKPC